MGLTEEQKERIRINRERALELRKRKLEEERKEQEDVEQEGGGSDEKDKIGRDRESKRPRSAEKDDAKNVEREEAEDVELEAFEEGASEFVTKNEAMKMYCLPAGTLAVCEVIEKPNPRNGAWSAMKLYRRSEVRRRSRQRFGGLVGLAEERRKREEKRFASDMEKTKNIFR